MFLLRAIWAKLTGQHAIYEYFIRWRDETGTINITSLVALNEPHAREEATYECPCGYGDILEAKRGDFLYYQ